MIQSLVHINFSARKEEDWEKARRELGKIFRKEPYGNFVDIYADNVESVLKKLRESEVFKRIEIVKNPNYVAWIQIYL